MAIGTRLNMPLLSQTCSAGREVMYSTMRIGFPAWAGVTDWRAACPWFYCNENPGGAPPEVDLANGGSLWVTLGISGVFTMGTFDGAFEGIMSANSWGRWVKFGDPVYTPSGTGAIRCANVVATNGLRPIGLSRISSASEASEWSAGPVDLTKIRTGGTITNNTTGYFYGPCLLVGKGNDGRMVPLILGNSIDFGNDENASLADTRGNTGFWARGFDDVANRLPYGNFAVPGSRMGQQASLASGAFQRRGEILRSLETGVPFDLAVGGNENEALNDSYAWRKTVDDFADFINQTFGMPFAHRTLLPKVTYSGNKPGTDLANQTAVVDQRLATNTLLINTPAQFPTFQIGEAFHDSGSTGKWKVPAFATTVNGAYGGSGTISLVASPPLGTALVFNDGISSVATCIVTAVSGSGPYNVTCVPTPPVQAGGEAVKASNTDNDGTHPTSDGHLNLGAPVVVTGKANFR